MTQELKPCPFCGGKAHFDPSGLWRFVVCTKCRCGTEAYLKESTAARHWNKRVSTRPNNAKDAK